MVTGAWWKAVFLLVHLTWKISATTHWIVTENGRILSHFDSPFHLRRPYDLIALLDQETRRNDVITLYQDLSVRAQQIDKKWSGLEGASDLEARLYTQDADCLKADKRLNDIDLYANIVTNGSNRGLRFNAVKRQGKLRNLIPECEGYSRLDFSMFAYEHLPAMTNRRQLNAPSEAELERYLPIPSIRRFGSELAMALEQNSTSWLLYNLGVLYWRILGDAPRAIECGRRALFYAPREYRDIPLVNMAGVLHQARYSEDAALLLHAAIDHDPYQLINYVSLGNIYAVLSDYNNSVACYNTLLRLSPDMDEILKTKHATMCHWKLTNVLLKLHAKLDGTLADLHDYHGLQQQLLRLQERLIWERAPFEAQMAGYTSDQLGSVLANRGQRCVQKVSGDAQQPTISCDFTDNHPSSMAGLQMDAPQNLQKLLENVELESRKINEQMNRNRRQQAQQSDQRYGDETGEEEEEEEEVVVESERERPELFPKYPTTMSTSGNLYFDETGWPSKDECWEWELPLKEKEDLVVPVYFPPENKGFQVDKILTEYINLPENVEHDLPWHPPVCDDAEMNFDRPYLPTSILRQLPDTPVKSYPNLLKNRLLKYVNDGRTEEAEIGQRIVTAIKLRAGPHWVLTTLASLYWRARSNTKNTLNCLNEAFKTVPKQYTDVLLVSIGSILHQVGLVDDAIKLATMAFKVNYVEPSTNFLLALLHYTKNNPILAMYYMKNVLRVDPHYYDGMAVKLLRTWACRIRTGSYEEIKSKEVKVSEGMCSEKDSFQGEGVICSASGEQCKTAAIQCFRTDDAPVEATDTIETVQGARPAPDEECSKQKVGLGHSLISTLLAAESPNGKQPEPAQLENFLDGSHQPFHMRISLGEDQPNGGSILGYFYVFVTLTDDPIPEAVLHIYDKSGTYPLSPRSCRSICDTDWLHFTSMWQSIAARNVDVTPLLKSVPEDFTEVEPFCTNLPATSTNTLDHLTATILRRRLPSGPEEDLAEWLGLMTGDHEASVGELGTKISLALQENTTSWILAMAAAIYWRVVGGTEEAVTCLRQALIYVPIEMKDIPLINLANLLNRVGFHTDALDIAYRALDSHPDFVVNHFTLGNIHTSLGDLEKAISFYRSALSLDSNFEPARNRLQAILCTLLFDETGSLRDSAEILEN